MKSTRLTFAALAVAVLLGASACGSDDGPSTDDEAVSVSATDTATSSTDKEESSDSSSESEPAPESGEDLEPLMAAIATVEKSLGGTAYEVDDQDNGDGTWEINVAVKDKSIEAVVSQDGSKVVSQDDEETLDADDAAGLKAAKVSIGEAIETARKETGGFFDDAELEQKDGTHVWEVSIDTADGDVDVLVDVTSGKVIGTRTD